MEHQDWETLYVHCKGSKNKTKESSEKEVRSKKPNEFSKEKKLEGKIDNGELKHRKIDKELSKKIQQARLSGGMTQKDLANKLALQSSVINDIECGRAIYNHQQINKIKRLLKI